jgi:acyl-CoA thioester hydrolase
MSAASPSPVGGPWSTRRRFRVNYHDLDPLNHLNHAVYFPWMETLRCDYYLPFVGSTDPRDIDIIIAEATCRYLEPIAYGDEVVGEVTPARPLGRTSFTLLYRFQRPDGKEVVARGRTVVVCYDYVKARKKEIPPDRRAILERDGINPASEGWS